MTTQQQDIESLPGFLCSKALDVREIELGMFGLVDALGKCTAPSCVADGDLRATLRRLGNIVPIAHIDGSLLLGPRHMFDGATIPWALHEPYVARVPDLYRIWLCGKGDFHKFDAKQSRLPLAYGESGFGTGDRQSFEEIHAEMSNGKLPWAVGIPQELLTAYLRHAQLKRLCDDQLALIDRAVKAFQRVLNLMRRAVRENAHALKMLGAVEIQHACPACSDIATFVTMAAISAVTSMDIMTRLVAFINDTDLPPKKFRPQGASYFANIQIMKPKALPLSVLDRIREAWSCRPSIDELVQFRHDVIHSTTALELERRIYIGYATAEINSLDLHYAQLPARDCESNGQPVRFLAREFFTGQHRNMDEVLGTWLVDVVTAHIVTAREIQDFITGAIVNATHTLPGT